LGNKDIVAAYQKLEEQGSIIEVKDRDRRLNGIVKQYLEKPRETIIVTASNRDREDLNNLIRSSLVNDKKVSNDSLDVITRENVRLTSTERYFTDSYNITDVLVANKDGILGDAGSEARIMGVDESNHTLLVSTNNGQVVVDVKEHGGDLQVYKEQHRQFASGDKIIFLKNDKQLEVKNGQTAIIQSIDLESRNIVAKMDNGSLVTLNPDKQYKYLGHGYAITDYKSQGQTEKHVIYHADTNKKVTFNQAYVGITRGKQSVTIYTNDSEHLKESMQKDQVKTSTLDYKIPADIRKINNEYSNKLNKDSVAHTNTRSIEKPKENIAQRTIDRSQGMER
jgi:ATP-dependent exoDNAse (exonuclease V) alpha subunit